MFYAIDLEDRIRPDHPLRPIKIVVDEILRELGPLFDQAYSKFGRPSVPPEVLLKALLLKSIFSVRSESQLIERLDTDLLFRWFCGLDPAETMFDPTAFTHNRPRLDQHGITSAFFAAVVKRAIDSGLASDEHFSVDGTMIESYASIKSFKPIEEIEHDDEDDSSSNDDNNSFKSRNAEVDFHGKKRSNKTHRSTTDPEARLYRKSCGHEAKLAHMAHSLCENRHGLIMAVEISEASGTAECDAALKMLDDLYAHQHLRPRTLGADRGFDSGPWLIEVEQRGITPHVAMREGTVGGEKQTSARLKKNRPRIAARQRMAERLSEEGYQISQRCRKKVEEGFGWWKTIGGLVKARLIGRWKIRQEVELTAAAYDLIRMRNLLAKQSS